MMPGGWVTRADGTHWQVARIIDSQVTAMGGIPVRTTLYELRSVTGESAWVHQWPPSTRNASHLGRTAEPLTPYTPTTT